MTVERQTTAPATPTSQPTNQIVENPTVTDTTITPTVPSIVPAEIDHPETPRDKRERLMVSGKLYRDSPVYQAAAQTWALVELVDATDSNTKALREQTAIEEQKLDEMRIANLLAFYAMNSAVFPPGVEAQLKAALGISVASPATEQLAPETGPQSDGPAGIETGVRFD